MSRFPDDFWWGTGASSTQTEGAAPASDWAAWEQAGKAPPSGEGNGFGARYREDFALLAAHGLTHHRLSLEWARLEPEPGKHDVAAVEHYVDLLRTAREHGIDVWACLHHFTLPGWFSKDEHGFTDDRARRYFWPRHVDFMAETFGDLLFGWMPVNEPAAYAVQGWLEGSGPPGIADADRFPEALEAIHLAAFEAALRLRETGKPVATVHNLSPVTTSEHSIQADQWRGLVDHVLFGCWTRAMQTGILQVRGRGPIERPEFQEAFTHVGFSYYNALAVDREGAFSPYPGDARTGPLGYAPWSEGLMLVLQRLAEDLPGRPLVIAEHGIGTTDDGWRESFLRDSLGLVEQALADGIDVRGFFHWTGIDNYEWHHGFQVPFGLFDADRAPKPSATLAKAWATRPTGV